MKLTHIIGGLMAGGAEGMLYKLVTATPSVSHSVVSLTGEGVYGQRLRSRGVPVTTLNMRRGLRDALALGHVLRLLRRDRPDVVQSWMYHANLLAGIAAAPLGIPVVWGLRQSSIDPGELPWLTHRLNVLCALLSGTLPARIVCCAESARRSHVRLGYRSDKMVVIGNGFDLSSFAPDPAARARLRRDLSIPDDALVVGLVARFHPDKDHRNFIAAASAVKREHPSTAFVLVGADVDPSNRLLSRWIADGGLEGSVHLLGFRTDVAALLPAFDVLALSSRTEAFPQVLGEAMSCGVPCAATDCGDSRDIIGETGRVAPPHDPAALASAIGELLSMPVGDREVLGAVARHRVRARYDLSGVAQRYLELYTEVASEGPSARRIDSSVPFRPTAPGGAQRPGVR